VELKRADVTAAVLSKQTLQYQDAVIPTTRVIEKAAVLDGETAFAEARFTECHDTEKMPLRNTEWFL